MTWRDDFDDADDVSNDADAPDEFDVDEDDDPELVPCPYCGKAVSEEAERCPHCGNYIIPDARNGRRKLPTWIVIAAALAIMGIMGWFLI